MKHHSRILKLALIVAMLAFGVVSNTPPAAAAGHGPDAPGWVGNMNPAGGSSSPITAGGALNVSIEVWKNGVTPPAGQGANITCTLHWGQVASFGGGWSNVTDTPMTYDGDTGNNDRYKTSISPGAGLYEFTAFCTDTTDNSVYWQSGGNGRLTVNAPSSSCSGANLGDNNVYWAGLLHDSFSSAFRNPIGPVTTAQGTVTLKLRTCQNDVQSASIRVWNDRDNIQTISALTFDSNATEPGVGNVTYWKIDLPIPATPTILYYVFSATDGAATAYYRDDDPKFYGGGYGAAEGSQGVAYDNSYQLTVYDPAFAVPAWMQRGVVYQIFPDRFRDGDSSNDPAAGRFFYNVAGGTIARSNQGNWNYTVCDPRSTYSPSCAGRYSENFYGGDLQGVIDKIDDGYFDNLGISVLYLNPIFRSPSNHKYDTADYKTIDPDFGTLAKFQELATKAENHGIKLILDGVFNHTSSDSTYFDRFSRYDAAGNLTSPGVGTNDNSGACEATSSGFRSWFYLPDVGTPARDGDPGSGPLALCAPLGVNQTTYEAWYGYSSLPKLQANSAAVRSLIWNNGTSSVGPYWVSQGADGWRFDVGGDVDPGVTNDPTNTYWEGFRTAVRSQNNQTLTLGEEWGDASAWLLGNEWDSVMNYRFRSALLSWLATGCSGSGCSGGVFQENDSNNASSSGPISTISPSQFNARLRSIAEDYPPMSLQAMMNLEGSHDTNRVRFLLKKVNNNSDGDAVQRMKEWWLFSFTYPGAPTLYYGDEIGLNHDGVWDGSTWQDDPYNRAPFPWPDASGSSYGADTGLQDFARTMASIYWSYGALQDGDVQHGLIIDDANKLYGYARTNGSQTALIALNRDNAAHNATFSGLNAAPYNLADGTQLVNALSGDLSTVYVVSGGSVTVSTPSNWGVVLLEKNKLDVPAAVPSIASAPSGGNVILTWPTVRTDTGGNREVVTGYEIHSGPDAGFTPTDATRVATVTPSDASFRFGYTNGQFTWTGPALRQPNAAYYKVCTVNAPGVTNRIGCPTVTPLAVTLADFSAVQQGNAVLLTWETTSELHNRGFNLYRGTSDAGWDTQLNATLIPSQSQGNPGGFVYTWEDRASLVPGTTYYYWVEDVQIYGAATMHGPVSVDYAVPTAVTVSGIDTSPAGSGMPAGAALLALLAALAGATWLRRRRV